MLRSLAIGGTVAGLVVALGLIVAACAVQEPAPTATPQVTSRPTFTPTGASFGCEACHSDKEKLKAVAAAEKEQGEVACKG